MKLLLERSKTRTAKFADKFAKFGSTGAALQLIISISPNS
jgi:hypothetical protein